MCESFVFISKYLWTKLFYGFSRWLYLFGVGMVVCVDGGGYYRYVWVCACYNRGLKFFFFFFSFLTINFFYIFFSVFQFWSAFLECVCVFFLNLRYVIFMWCLMFRRVHIAAKGMSPRGQQSCLVLYCTVLYCIVFSLPWAHTRIRQQTCIVLYWIGLYCTVLDWIGLDWIVLYCIVLYCIVFSLPWVHTHIRQQTRNNRKLILKCLTFST